MYDAESWQFPEQQNVGHIVVTEVKDDSKSLV